MANNDGIQYYYFKILKMNKRKINAFTLVELLIVIALIGILAVAVLATINPIEQANKARDAKFKNDAAEVLSAYERYYTGQEDYPWNISGIGATVAFGTEMGIGSTDTLFGVRGVGSSVGVLIATSELKSAFMGKEPFESAPDAVDMLYTYHNGNDSTYVCFVPKANANRTGNVGANLKCLTLGSGAGADIADLNEGTCVAMTDWNTAANLLPVATLANLLCVPEGDVVNIAAP